jgi:hypothetical protein
VRGQRRVARRRADQQAAVGALLDVARQAGHIDQGQRLLDGLAHQVDQVGAAAQVLGAGPAAQLHASACVGGAGVGEGGHARASRAWSGRKVSAMAATMPL